MELLKKLPKAIVAREEDVLHFIERHALFGTGLGYIEACLLTSVKLQPHASLWTGDKRMHAAAAAQSIRADPLH